jgi:hypothetical protein
MLIDIIGVVIEDRLKQSRVSGAGLKPDEKVNNC